MSSADFFPKFSIRNPITVSNSLDPDQARHFVAPDLGQNCLQRLSADNNRKQRVKVCMVFKYVNCSNGNKIRKILPFFG